MIGRCRQSLYISLRKHVLFAKKLSSSSLPGIKPKSSNSEANTLPRRYKSRLIPQCSTSVLYTVSIPCDTCKLQ